jgi:hypothetical protein
MQKYLHPLSTLWALALAGVLCASVGPAQAAVYVRMAPPAPQAEVVGPPPGSGPTWTNGYYYWDGRAYLWQPGRWVRPPHPHANWVAGHWRQTPRGWTWVPGHWRG